VQRSNGLLHNFLLHIILHGRLLPLSMLLLPIRVSLAHRSRKCGAGLFLHTSVVRALSLSLARARGDWAGLVKGGLSMCVGNSTGFVGFPVTPGCLTRPSPACSGISVPRRSVFRGRYPYVKCWLFFYTVLYRAPCMHAP
jgi:hypothetical protein